MRKLLYIIFFSLLLIAFSISGFAQTGGTTCGGALNFAVDGCSPSATLPNSPVGSSLFCNGAGPLTVRVDRWYKFTTNTYSTPGTITTTISVTTTGVQNSTRNIAFEVYRDNGGACPGTYVACVDAGLTTTETIVLPLNQNTIYYVRVCNICTAAAPSNNTGTKVCVKQSPENDEPNGAFLLPVGNGVCNPISSTNTNASSSACLPLPACANYVPTASAGNSGDVWYKLVVPTSGNFFVQTTGDVMTNAGMAVYSSSLCGSATILGCSDGSPHGIIDPTTSFTYTDAPMAMPGLNITGAVANSTVYVRVWNENGHAAGPFYICASDMTPCGNLATNDYCSNPVSISTSGVAGTYTNVAHNNTGLTYTNDLPGDLNYDSGSGPIACTPPTLNSWYTFIASMANQTGGLTLPIAVGNAPCTGLNAQIFAVTTINGCCKNFTQLSNPCPSAVSVSSNFNLVVPPGSLMAGLTYYLMVNNNEASCSYSITGFQFTGTLPVEFVSFIGNNEGKYNQLEWITASEKNMLSYTLQHSADATNFSDVVTLNAKNNQDNTKYSTYDEDPFEDVTYYRVKQKEISGTEKYTNTISVSLKSLYDNIYNIHPNPTTNNLNFEYYSKSYSAIAIELINYAGASVIKLNIRLEEGKNNITLPMSQLDNGVYILKVVSEKSGKTTYHKIIKN